MSEERPKWVRTLRIVSILIAIFPAVFFISNAIILRFKGKTVDAEFWLFIPITLFVMFVILAMWGVGVFINYLTKKGHYGFATAVPIIGFFGTLTWYAVVYIASVTGPYPATYNLDWSSLVSLLLMSIPLIYFGTAFMIVKRNKKSVVKKILNNQIN